MKDQPENDNLGDLKKSCVGWFRLAELVTRREKEKALSLYRLISHSFDDKAYVLQVEGDILWALQDENALEKYSQAAYLYKKEKKFLSAAAIYEHTYLLKPENINNIKSLILIYLLLSWPEKFEQRFLNFIELEKKELISQETFFSFVKNIFEFATNSSNVNLKYLELDNIFEDQTINEHKWVIKSIINLLKKQKSDSYENILKYCLDNNLNFNA
ncbi:hypothetical protein KJ644_01515 [Candidatus Dependentiae bacterium]|nr:hypothetical protein [Candidatus Dependentiae bacterium]MBU4387130.1 hypothetical protein [Candidatus Dependentiae bacterium]MCG2755992.1 hypothetical protein [Candidatus Dependentiae bacterium]